jgi:hypothetical protein
MAEPRPPWVEAGSPMRGPLVERREIDTPCMDPGEVVEPAEPQPVPVRNPPRPQEESMTAPISPEHEQNIRALLNIAGEPEWHMLDRAELAAAVRTLLAELERLRTEHAQADASDRDLSGWTAAENAEFEELYGVQAAMRLRASNNRIWQIVQELRTEAADAGLDPYQDPMAQRLSAALVQPEPEEAER